VIRGFADPALEDLYDGVNSARARRLRAIAKPTLRKLDMLNAAAILDDLKAVPGNRLEQLDGDLAGYHSIRVNDQWRIVFRWTEGGPEELKLTDYH
jgi:proteic killer suppression protein